MRRVLWPLAAIACLLVGFTFGFAQQQQPTAYWYVTQYQIDFRRTDSLSKLIKAFTPAREELKRSGNLLEERWLLHHTGNEWNVLHIRKFPSWAAMNDEGAAIAALRKAVPDSVRRDAMIRAGQELFQANAHRDGIYVEIGI
jgi:hypothetical protein